ncbi:serine hydrolase domain-containing protein [Phenylobacterium sp.]|jgi:D-alanyl-D-alanine carboxypeptidase|uniref:serine hydrolase domain-containing protein n=1 Tax=Phenylobacterium sp. TaxID=1871053 RepID=UPI003785223F
MKIRSGIIAAALAAGLCSSAAAQPQAPEARLQAAIEEIARSDKTIPGVIAAVSAPRWGLEWQGATGALAIGKPEPVKTTDAFRIASVTKVYVAATAIRLIEQGKFGIYDPMSPLISDQTRKLLKDDGYDVDAITVFQLLTHTSGLYDNSTSPAFAAAVMKDPGHKWTREEQIAFGMKNGEPVAPPGRDYNYSELSYLVLGEIIERATGKRLADAVSYELQLPARGLSSTYWETYQPAPAGERRAHQYVGPLDARVIDASMDLFGGGGLVSTVGDLVRFVRPLLQGDMFDKSPTLAMALQIPPTANGKLAHAPLLGASRFGKRMCWSHGGYWGVSMVYCPDIDVAIAVAWNQADGAAGWRGASVAMSKAIEDIERAQRTK